MNQISSSHY